MHAVVREMRVDRATICRRPAACVALVVRLQFCHMHHTISVRLSKDLAAWLERAAADSGVSQGQIVRDELEQARKRRPQQTFMRLAGAVRGPRDLSARKGFARR